MSTERPTNPSELRPPRNPYDGRTDLWKRMGWGEGFAACEAWMAEVLAALDTEEVKR